MVRPPDWQLRILPALTILLLGAALFLLPRSPHESPRSSPNPTPTPAVRLGTAAAATAPNQANASASPTPVRQSLRAALESVLAHLPGGSAEANRAALQKLKEALESAPSADSIAAIREFLVSGRDAATGLPYAVGVNGRLENAPSLRIFLLDELGALCKQGGDPRSSLAVARDVLASPGSADEWSLALRNVAWADPNSGAFLNEKFRELINQPQWVQNPSSGMLETFDVPVYTHDTASIALLAPFLTQQSDTPSSLSRATAIALDRLAEQSPLDVMTYLNNNPSVLSDTGMLRADYYSKADLSDSSQRGALETYFARADVTDAEKVKTVEGLFSPGSFVSDSLLTSTPAAPDPTTQARILGQLADDWAKRFPAIGPRLKELLRQTN